MTKSPNAKKQSIRRRCGNCRGDPLAGNLSKPPLDQIQPRTRARDEVDVESGMPSHPGFDPRVFVGCVIVHDKMQIEMRRRLRQYRDPNARTMLGKTQKEWLLNNVSKSTAVFKFIATSVPMFGGGRDRWDGYPEERKEIVSVIAERKLTGVVFLSADLHYAAITRLPDTGDLKDITAGPLAAPLNRIAKGDDPAFEYFSADRFNFAKITIDPTVNPTDALVEFIDADT